MSQKGYQLGLGVLLALAVLPLTQGVASAAGPGTTAVPGRLLVGFRPGVARARASQALMAAGVRSEGELPQIGVHLVKVPRGLSGLSAAHRLLRQQEVAFAEPDALVQPDALPNDPYFKSEWHLSKIAAPSAWDSTVGSDGVTIAVLDTGVDSSHPDLAGKLVPGWNFWDNNADTSDVYGHGTKVAGTIAAVSNNSAGVASVAWNCRIMPIRISDVSGGGTISAMASGLTYAADHGARAANISYMVTGSSTLDRAAAYFQKAGGVVTVSAGNYSSLDTNPDDPYILTVSATDSNDMLASWSNFGSDIDLAAPGVSIYTTTRGGGYGGVSGTSFSAPIVAAVAALVISANPALTGSQVQDVLKQSADDLGPGGWDPQYGTGRVNAARAVALALTVTGGSPTTGGGGSGGSEPDTTAPSAAIIAPVTGSTVGSSMVSVTVDARDDRAVVKVELYVDGQLTGASTSAPFTVKWNPRKVPSGLHVLQCKAYDAAGNQCSSAPVTVSR